MQNLDNNLDIEVDHIEVDNIIHTGFFKIINSTRLIARSKYVSFQNVENILEEIELYEIKTGLMIGYVCIDENSYVFIFALDKHIILIDQNSIQKFQSFINRIENQSKIYYIDSKCLEIIQQNQPNKYIANKEMNQTYLFEKICLCIIKKSLIRTKMRRYESKITINAKNTEFNYKDFMRIYLMRSRSITFQINLKDQFLYCIKYFEPSDDYKIREFSYLIDIFNKINIKNPFICKMYDHTEFDEKKIVIFDYIEGQDLHDFISKKDKKLEEEDKMKIILQIMCAIEYWHMNNFFLRNLNFHHIIIDSNQNAILVNYNCAKSIMHDDEEMTAYIGHFFFMSPEQYRSNNYSYKTDIYSLGKIIQFILTETLPNSINNFQDDHSKNLEELFKEYYKIYKYCLEENPELRPDISQIINETIFFVSKKFGNKPFLNEINEIHVDMINDKFLNNFSIKDSIGILNTIKGDNIVKYSNIDDILSEIEGYVKNTGIMFGDFENNENFNLFIFFFIFDRDIIIADVNNIEKILPFFKKLLNPIQINDINSKIKSKSSDDIQLLDEKTQIELSQKIQKKIVNSIIKKIQLRTENRHNQTYSFKRNKTIEFNYKDFLLMRYFTFSKALQLNMIDQFLYILIYYDKNDSLSCKLFDHLITFFSNNINPFIIKMYGTTQNNSSNILICEYIEKTSLKDFIDKEKGKLAKEEKYRIILQILCALESIYLNNFIFKDLRIDDFVIDSKRNVILNNLDSLKSANENETNFSFYMIILMIITETTNNAFDQNIPQDFKDFYQICKDFLQNKINISRFLNQAYDLFKPCLDPAFLNDLYNVRKKLIESLVKLEIINEQISDLFAFLNYPELF